MTTWADLYNSKGIYTSQVFDVSSNFETYVQSITTLYDKNDGSVDIYIKISNDGVTWSDWVNVNNIYSELFVDDFYYLEKCKFQYKVEMNKYGIGVSPVFKEFYIGLMGAFTILNSGDVVCKPELWITKRNSNGTIRLTNETNGQILELKNLNKDEQVYIDCDNQDIVSNLPLTYRYNDHNNVFLDLELGENQLTGEGDFDLVLRLEFKTLQG